MGFWTFSSHETCDERILRVGVKFLLAACLGPTVEELAIRPEEDFSKP